MINVETLNVIFTMNEIMLIWYSIGYSSYWENNLLHCIFQNIGLGQEFVCFCFGLKDIFSILIKMDTLSRSSDTVAPLITPTLLSGQISDISNDY